MENNEREILEVNENHENKKGPQKNNKIWLAIFILLIVFSLMMLIYYLPLALNNMKKDNKDDDNKVDITPNVVESAYRISGNSLEKFDLTFLQIENNQKNMVYSPLSIKYALGMLSEGANGDSKEQIDAVIGDYVVKKYTNSSNMSFANALFIRDSYKENITEKYTNILSDKYNADVIYDPFENANTLNNWVKNKTFNLISDLEDNLDDKDFVLVNALALDMEWENKIQKQYDVYSVKYNHENYSMFISPLASGYHSLNFYNSKQNAQSVEIGASINKYDIVTTLGEDNIRQEVKAAYEEYLKNPCSDNEPDAETYLNQYIEEINSNYNQISSSTDFYFYDDEEIKVFAKDLQEYDGTTLQYVGIMPKSIGLDTYIENTDASEINTILNNLKEIKLDNFEEGFITKITGYIPMFNFEYELNLQTDLELMGISDIFSFEKADISGITSDKNAFINSASHKSNIEFSNDGIKAAAVTVEGGLGDASCGFSYNYDVPVKEINLTFDNPYLFLIRDKNSGEVWFMGTVYEPVEYVREG